MKDNKKAVNEHTSTKIPITTYLTTATLNLTNNSKQENKVELRDYISNDAHYKLNLISIYGQYFSLTASEKKYLLEQCPYSILAKKRVANMILNLIFLNCIANLYQMNTWFYLLFRIQSNSVHAIKPKKKKN